MTIEEAHDVVEEVEEQIRKLDPWVKWIISTHIDPYDDYHLNKLLHEC
jgi:divalent metal cation (Fe/Co/Zn/Cd) transporter